MEKDAIGADAGHTVLMPNIGATPKSVWAVDAVIISLAQEENMMMTAVPITSNKATSNHRTVLQAASGSDQINK